MSCYLLSLKSHFFDPFYLSAYQLLITFSFLRFLFLGCIYDIEMTLKNDNKFIRLNDEKIESLNNIEQCNLISPCKLGKK